MIERPILFKGPLVRAILDGTKTKTRRLPRFQPAGGVRQSALSPTGLEDGHGRVLRCQHGAPGDHLWVRETWKSSTYSCAEDPQEDDHKCSEHCKQTYVYYRATPRVGYRPVPDKARITYLDESSPLEPRAWYESGWKPSIHMPRWASRIDLEVTEVRVQRLQDITIEDAIAEGIPQTYGHAVMGGFIDPERDKTEPHEWDNRTSVENFAVLWDAINGDRASWESNPWVWVVEFKRIRP